ncbi:hypothetical protein GF377_09890, partial [candidate division GN15 bacterium]|nr:hypothetical protein [candidate division GN15 bacterium]
MRYLKTMIMPIIGFSLLLVSVIGAASTAVAEGEGVEETSIWVGMSYKDTTGYAKKVAEYNLLEEVDQVLPEFMVKYLSIRENNILRLSGQYVDYENINGKVTAVVGDQFRGDFEFRSTTKQGQQDLLENIEAREWLPVPARPSGKMLTHELQDEGVDYSHQRAEILSRMELLLSQENNVRLVAAHRSVLKKGNTQTISANHCFSCHLTSQETELDEKTH